MSTRLVVLDVNETLSDLTPLKAAFTRIGLPALVAQEWFAAVLRDGFALTVAGTQPVFADLAADHVRRLLAQHASPTDPDEAVAGVMETFLGLDVHPDVGPGLEALTAAGLRVVTLSNGATTVAEGLLTRAGLAQHVERSLSVDDAGVWKPHARAYGHALEECGVEAAEAVLVAVHPWDTDGAQRAGLRSAYVDRRGGPFPASFLAPDLVVRDLTELAGRL